MALEELSQIDWDEVCVKLDGKAYDQEGDEIDVEELSALLYDIADKLRRMVDAAKGDGK